MKNNKRGLSTVVATLLIVLITISVGTLVAQFIIPYVQDNLREGGECIDYGDYYQFVETLQHPQTGVKYNYNCYSLGGATGTYLEGFSIKAKDGINASSQVRGFRVVLTSSDGAAKVIEVNTTTQRSIIADGVWMLGNKVGGSNRVDVPRSGETISYVYNTGAATNPLTVKAEVYPILVNGRICAQSDNIRYNVCAGGLVIDT